MDGFSATLIGARELRRDLDRLDGAFRGRALLAAVTAGALPILNRTKENVHKVTGTLARSYHIGVINSTPDSAEVAVGTDVVYARREELGFIGQDRLGRRYNFEGHPHLRPAFDEKRGEAEHEIAAALGAILARVIR
jgi:hypothetical protein